MEQLTIVFLLNNSIHKKQDKLFSLRITLPLLSSSIYSISFIK